MRAVARLGAMRVRAQSRMLSRVTIGRLTGAKTTNVAGYEVDAYAPVDTGVPFRLGGSEQGGSGYRTVKIGGVETQVAVRVGSLPVTFSDLQDLDVIEITEGENAGKFLHIAEASWQDQASARRVPVFETQRPEGWT